MNVEQEAKSSAAHSSALNRIKNSYQFTESMKKLFDLAYQLGFCDGILKGTEEIGNRIVEVKEEILFRSNLRDSQ